MSAFARSFVATILHDRHTNWVTKEFQKMSFRFVDTSMKSCSIFFVLPNWAWEKIDGNF